MMIYFNPLNKQSGNRVIVFSYLILSQETCESCITGKGRGPQTGVIHPALTLACENSSTQDCGGAQKSLLKI